MRLLAARVVLKPDQGDRLAFCRQEKARVIRFVRGASY